MKQLFLLLLLLCFRFSFAQCSLKKQLQQDFLESRKKPYSMHSIWYAQDTVSIVSKDTIILHNNPQYRSKTGSVCKLLALSFTSRTSFTQSAYFPCMGHGYFVTSLDGSGMYSFSIRENSGKTYLKFIDYQRNTYWFEATRSLEYNLAYKRNFPAINLMRLKHRPI